MKVEPTGSMRTRLPCSTRGVCVVSTRNDDVLLVQHLVVLEAVQQRRGRAFRIAGEKHRRPRNPLRRLSLQHAHQIVERRLEPAGFLEQEPRAAPPRVHHQHDDAAERQRHPAALDDLEHVGGKKSQIDEEERQHQRRRGDGDQRHIRQMTMKAIMPVTTMVPVTAMP